MLANYLRIAIRNLLKNKSFSLINILGLTLGITCCVLITLYVRHEAQYDTFHKDADRIYRLRVDCFPPNGPVETYATAGYAQLPTLLNDYPEVEQGVRLKSVNSLLLKTRQGRSYETCFFADSTFFEVFNFPLLAGDPKTALTEPFSMVLPEATALQYFGSTDILGETLLIDDSLGFKITGIMADIPSNSHIQFRFLSSFNTLQPLGIRTSSWWSFGVWSYFRLRPDADREALAEKVHRMSANYIGQQETGSGYRMEHYLQPLRDIHLHSNLRNEIQANNRYIYVYIFGIIAAIILLIACINFMNLATSRSLERAREVGLRKVIGAGRVQLAIQFLGESLILASVAAVLALGLVEVLLPHFNNLTARNLEFDIFENGSFVLVLSFITVLVGLLAGSYPAVFLSSFRPVETLKGKFRSNLRGALFRKILVITQFAIASSLIIGTIVVYKQLSFMRSQDLGFNIDQILILPTRREAVINKQYEALKDRLLQEPSVSNVCIASGIPGRTVTNSVFRIEGNNVDSPYGTDGWNDMRYLNVDADFFNMYELEVVAGRFFPEDILSSEKSAFVLNEAAVEKFGWGSPEAAIGKRMGFASSNEGEVIGVVRDFHFRSLQTRIEPLVLTSSRSRRQFISVQLSASGIQETLSTVQSIWGELIPNRPFEYFFLDTEFNQQYRNDETIGKTFGLFTILAIFIASLGLFGLAAYTSEQRTREIGIRKTLGASISSIVNLLSVDFLKLVLIANLIAWPLSYVTMHYWLNDFAYKTDINAWIFILASGIAVAISFFTVAYQALRAANGNLIDALKYE